MYERFSDRARKVMQLANLEAQKLNHEYIGTEHILLGILREGNNVSTRILECCGIRTSKIEEDIRRLVQAGPDIVVMGKLPMTPRAKIAIEYTIDSAREMKCGYVGTEHILMGLAREVQGVAANVLAANGITLETITKFMTTSVLEMKQDTEDPHNIKLDKITSALLQYYQSRTSPQQVLIKIGEILES